MKTALVECAWGATRTKNSYYKRKYENLVKRRGKKKALVAVGHKIIVAAYHIIKNKEEYKEPEISKYETKKSTKSLKNMLNKIDKLGFSPEELFEFFEKEGRIVTEQTTS